MAFTLIEATEFFNAAKQGYLSALKMQEYTIKDRSAKKAEVDKLKKEMLYWKGEMGKAEKGTSGKITTKRYVPID